MQCLARTDATFVAGLASAFPNSFSRLEALARNGAAAAAAAICRTSDPGTRDGWRDRVLSHALSRHPGMRGDVSALLRDEKVADEQLEGALNLAGEIGDPVFCDALAERWARDGVAGISKLGMALYREHVGEPLPLGGGVYTMWFLNSGLSEETAHGMLGILPGYSTLKQGRRKNAAGQFDYRFNSDDRSIVAALTHFHSNIHFFTVSMADPALYGFPRPMPFTALVRPGELLKFMPKPPPAILMPAKPGPLASNWLLVPR